MWVFVVKQGGAAEAAIDGVNEAIDSMTNIGIVLVVGRFSGREMTEEHWRIDNIFIDLRGRHFRGPNREFVSRRRVSRDAGTDVILFPLRFNHAF